MDFYANIYYDIVMKLSREYILHDQLRNLLDGFTGLVGIRIGIFTPDMVEIGVGLKKKSCEYCNMLRSEYGRESKCVAEDRKMAQKAMSAGKAVCYKCHGSLTEAIFPLVDGSESLGFLMIGQFRVEGQIFSTSPGLSPADKKRLMRAYEKIPVYSESQVKHILDVCRAIVELTISKGLMSARQWKTILPVVERIRRQPEKRFSLEQAAGLAGVSKSTLSHLFTKFTGMSFKEYQIRHMLEAAEVMMRSDPEKSIAEIARRMGYEDQFYFSRLFRKYKGVPPSRAKNR